MHRYTFPESSEAGFILDLDYSLQGQHNRALSLEVVNDSTICGYKNTNSWAWRHDVYFRAVFSKPFTCEILTDSILRPKGQRSLPVKKALLHFATAKDEQVLVKVALSSVDAEGAVKNLAEIGAVGHRVVHGGEKFASSVVITEEVLSEIEACNELAPLHNPANIIGINACKELMPGTPMVAVFDTAFHQTMPKKA